MTYAITNDKHEIIWEFADELFIKKTLDIFNECVAQDNREFDHEAKKLGFNLTEYIEPADDCIGGGIIIDNDCFNACIKFWEEYGGQFNRCKVWKSQPTFPNAQWHWKDEPEYYRDEETNTYSWTNEEGYSVYVDHSGSWNTKEEIDLTKMVTLIDIRHEDSIEIYYNDKPFEYYLEDEYTGKDLFDKE